MAKSTATHINIPKVDVRMSTKSNGSAQYVDSSAPPQPSPGVIEDMVGWKNKLVEVAESLRDDVVAAGQEPGGLIYMVWTKDGQFSVKVLPQGMKISAMSAILRGLALHGEQGAAQTMTVSDVVSKLGKPNATQS